MGAGAEKVCTSESTRLDYQGGKQQSGGGAGYAQPRAGTLLRPKGHVGTLNCRINWSGQEILF